MSSASSQTVPTEPTDEMIDAGLRATAAFLDIKGSQLTVNREKMRRRYKAMLAASTEPDEVANLRRRFDLELDAYAKDHDMAELRAVNKVLRKTLSIAHEAMGSAIRKCQATIEECISEGEEVKDKRLAIFGDLDIPLAQVGCVVRASDEALAQVERRIANFVASDESASSNTKGEQQ